jgi:hypothetical protein
VSGITKKVHRPSKAELTEKNRGNNTVANNTPLNYKQENKNFVMS